MSTDAPSPVRALHRGDARERLRDGDWIAAASSDDVDPAGDLHPPSNVAGDFRAFDVRMTLNRGEERSRFDHSVMVETQRAAFADRRDSLQDLRDGLLAELGHFRQASIARRRLELFDGVDVQRFADLVNSRRRHAGNVEHLEQSLGHRLAQLLQVARLAGLDEVANHGERGGAEAAHAGERSGCEQRRRSSVPSARTALDAPAYARL